MPQTFMDNDLKTMFEDARKQIRKKVEQENQFSNKKHSNSFLTAGNNNNPDLTSNSKDTSYRLSSSYLPPSALNYHSRDNSKLSGTAPLTNNSKITNYAQSSNKTYQCQNQDQMPGHSINIRDYMELKQNNQTNFRQTKIDMLKSELKSMLGSSGDGKQQNIDHIHQTQQSAFSRDRGHSTSNLHQNSCFPLGLNGQAFSTMNHQLKDSSKILVSQLISPQHEQKSILSHTPNRMSINSQEGQRLRETSLQGINSRTPSRPFNQMINFSTNSYQTSKTPTRKTLQNLEHTPDGYPLVTNSQDGTAYYEKGPSAEFRQVLQYGQDIESMLSKEEIYKIQNALLEAREEQLARLPYSYVQELQRLADIIQKTLGQRQEFGFGFLNDNGQSQTNYQ
ncbi:UNKNOWN [Stylonychia lemnae]|uniref:Uncharacterized protein n=1 Tax=Stylonychia lemnae TaxID=5949 RepID=A0A077ZRG7_STYLE|nr:UNKNOWN [Stylonychia lemnae]|eukprot:CDW71930.1 UNKNOWN [Stylonychia lemnae]